MPKVDKFRKLFRRMLGTTNVCLYTSTRYRPSWKARFPLYLSNSAYLTPTLKNGEGAIFWPFYRSKLQLKEVEQFFQSYKICWPEEKNLAQLNPKVYCVWWPEFNPWNYVEKEFLQDVLWVHTLVACARTDVLPELSLPHRDTHMLWM